MKFIHLIFILCFSISLYAQQDIESFLNTIPEIQFKEIESHTSIYKTYELKVKQPIDHKNKRKGYFYQKVFLSDRGKNNITVIATEGYNMSFNRLYEPAQILSANQVQVEHRFFGNSVPENKDWKYLTLEQATADLHHIRTLLGKYYQSKWVSTGISKGGQTTIAYRYFYPDDVTVSIPYVAPLNNAFEDKRIYKFLDTVGTEECRKAIKDFQKRMFKKRKYILPLLKWYARGGNQKFTYHTLEEAFEFGVLEYSFSFWQYGVDCGSIPDKNASVDEMVEHFINVVGISFYNDKDVEHYGPHYYQASTQLGYYGFDTKPFRRYIKAIGKNPHASFEPNKMKTEYDPKYNKKVAKWLAKKGHRFIYIYGEIDTWSATKVPESNNVDSEWFILKGRHHGDARISSFDTDEKRRLIYALEKWLNIRL